MKKIDVAFLLLCLVCLISACTPKKPPVVVAPPVVVVEPDEPLVEPEPVACKCGGDCRDCKCEAANCLPAPELPPVIVEPPAAAPVCEDGNCGQSSNGEPCRRGLLRGFFRRR